jgi:transposase-like protein
VTSDQLALYRGDDAWVQRFTALFIDAACSHRQPVGRGWRVDETYVRISGIWHYLYRAVDEHGQVVDVLLSPRRDTASAREFFLGAKIRTDGRATEVVSVSDRAPAYRRVVADVCLGAVHVVTKYRNNPVECDRGRLKARLKPLRGLKNARTTAVEVAGHAFVQNLRRLDYRSAHEAPRLLRVKHVFAQLTPAV